jgi:hypothetical protein
LKFLDEFPEFGTRVLEVMRQRIEDKVVTISHAKVLLTFTDLRGGEEIQSAQALAEVEVRVR